MDDNLLQSLNETKRQLAAMREVAQAMGANVELSTLLPAIIGSVVHLVNSDRASLFLIDDKTGELWSRVQMGYGEVIRLPPGSGCVGAVAVSRRPLRLDDAWSDPRFRRDIDEYTGYRTRSLLAVPIVAQDGVVKGVVEALNKNGGANFSDDDERLLVALGAEIAVALQRAFLFDELALQKTALARRVSELDLLVDLDEALLSADGVQAMLDVVVERARVLLPAAAASVALIDPRTSSLVFPAAVGSGHDQARIRPIPSDTGLAGVALCERRAVRCADASTDPRHAGMISRSTTAVPGPFIALPLLAPNNPDATPFGVLSVLRKQGEAPFTDEDERILSLISARVTQALVDQDRKEKSRTKQQLETIGHMLSGIVHDFKTPMTVISGYVQLIAVEDDPAERERSADIVLKSCEQMTTMIKQLLAFARGDSTVLLRKVWLETFTKDVETTLRRIVDQTAITLIVDGKSRSSTRLDDLKMQRALVNLVKNAREAIDTGKGTIRVEITDEGDDVVFSVADDGPGLAPEIETRLFDSFTTFGKKAGTGLGLALVKRIAEEHHGSVVVDSRPGEGCTFTIRIPRA